MPDPVCVVLPVHNPADRLPAVVADWRTALAKLGRPAELVIVDDGSTPAIELDGVRVLRHDSRRGFGACLRTALAATDQPLVATAALDYPYTPADLAALIEHLETEQEVIAGRMTPSLACGSRGGRPAPLVWRAVGVLYRGLARVCCGFHPERPRGWLGLRGHRHSWLGWLLFANPLTDPDSAFRLYRRELFALFPLQADGDFVHTEVVAKASFCTKLVAEVPLTPGPAAVPAADWAGWRWVFLRPEFTPQLPLVEPTRPVPEATVPADPAPVPAADA
jgi:glycosyltransferase involved in cell wall biosynthesis